MGEPAATPTEWSADFDPGWRARQCTVDHRPDLDADEFRLRYLRRRPVLFDVGPARNEPLRDLTSRERLLREAGERPIGVFLPLSRVHAFPESMSFAQYVGRYVDHGLTPDELAAARAPQGPKYLFGPSDPNRGWVVDRTIYRMPPCCGNPSLGELLLGVGGSGVGVHWHYHLDTMNETIHGRKRWLFYPPRRVDRALGLDPASTESSLEWVTRVLPTLPPAERPLECEVGVGQVIYVPALWWHMTLNLGQTVCVATPVGG
jgi:hypothetical protein